MKTPRPNSKRILILHVVNPHQFYFKFTDDCVNSEFSKFDFEIQLYGNELHSAKTYENGYSPVENELVIFFNLIFNKWIRGRVVSIGQEITLWCIDSGIWDKCAALHVLPLIPRFQENKNLVHLGGLSLLPTEKILNVETVEVETRLSTQWDDKTINYFKGIINTSKTFMFTEEFELTNHKFGVLAVESRYVAIKNVNHILLEMNNVAYSNQYAVEDLSSHICQDRLQQQLYHSFHNNCPIQMTNIKSVSARALSAKSGSVMSLTGTSTPHILYDDFDDSVSRQSFDTTTMLETEAKSSGSSIIDRHGRDSEVTRCDNLRGIASKLTNLSIQSKAEVSSNVANSEGQCHDDSVSTTVSSSAASHRPSGSDVLTFYECYLHTCKMDGTKELRQPLQSTMNWMDSMCKSTSTDNLNDNGRTDVPSPINAPSTTSTTSTVVSRRKMLASLARKENTTESANNGESSKNYIKNFGVPAGFAKNCLNTFGGLSSKK